jgi:hypothetical protein
MPKANFALASRSRSKVNFNMAKGDPRPNYTFHVGGFDFWLSRFATAVMRPVCSFTAAAAYFYINPTAVALSPLEIICIDKTGPAKGAATKKLLLAAAGVC